MQRPMFVVMVRNNVGQLEFCGLRTTPIAADELAKQKTEGKPGWTYVVDRYDVRIPIPRLVVPVAINRTPRRCTSTDN